MAFNPNLNSSSTNNLFNPSINKLPTSQILNPSPGPSLNYNQSAPSNPPSRPNFPGFDTPQNNPNGLSHPPVFRPPFHNNVYQSNTSLNSSRNSSPALNYSGHSNSPIPQQQHQSNSNSPSFIQGNSMLQSNFKNLPPSTQHINQPVNHGNPQNVSSQYPTSSYSQPLVNPPIPPMQTSVNPLYTQPPVSASISTSQPPISNTNVSQNQPKPFSPIPNPPLSSSQQPPVTNANIFQNQTKPVNPIPNPPFSNFQQPPVPNTNISQNQTKLLNPIPNPPFSSSQQPPVSNTNISQNQTPFNPIPPPFSSSQQPPMSNINIPQNQTKPFNPIPPPFSSSQQPPQSNTSISQNQTKPFNPISNPPFTSSQQIPISQPYPTNMPPAYKQLNTSTPPITQSNLNNPQNQFKPLNQQQMPPNLYPPPTSQTNPNNQDIKGLNPAISSQTPPVGTASLPFPGRQINSTMPPLVPSQVPLTQQSNQNPYSSGSSSKDVPQNPISTNQQNPNINRQMYPPFNPNSNTSQPNFPPQLPPAFPPSNQPNLNTIPTPANQTQANAMQHNHPNANQPTGPQYGSTNHYNGQQDVSQQMGRLNIHQSGFNKLWGHETVDLLQCRNIFPEGKLEPPVVKLNHQFANSANCSPEIFRCTLTRIPETNSLLQKSRLPLGILIHPFKDLTHLPVIQCSSIVRCRSCRTYINPFVYFIDLKRWKCNLCYRVNDLPEEFQYDPVTKTYGDPTRRPEIQSATIEYIAPSEYMLRPPQPAAYLFLLDVSASAAESGYLKICCDTLIEQIDNLPGDSRTQLAFICYDSTVHFYFLGEGASRPKEMTVIDIDDIFLPSPEDLLVNLSEKRAAILELLASLPDRHANPSPAATQSALGAALQAAHKLMSPTGGRITVFQTCLTNVGPGALTAREDPNNRSSKEVAHLNPATDFYKRLALDCSGVQIAVDLFLLNSQYADLSTISGVSRFSGGTVYHVPLFKSTREWQAQELKRCFTRYLTRKIGFEAVMRVRFSRGLAIHAFHGSFFVRSTDLLSLPNVSPDAGFGIQLSIEESLSDVQHVCFQAALLYTSSKGERRIRVHTLCLPVVATLTDIIHSADQLCIIGLLAKMAVDRSQSSSLADAREALLNAAVDALGTVKVISGPSHGLMCPMALRLLPLYLLALLKHTSFRTGTSTRLDDRVAAMCQMKSLPLGNLLRSIYPDLYPVHRLADYVQPILNDNEGETEEISIPHPPRLRLSAERVSATGAYLLDNEDTMVLYIGHTVHPSWIQNTLGVEQHSQIRDDIHTLPTLETEENTLLHAFIDHLNDEKPYAATLHIIRDNSPNRTLFTEKLADDRIESALSYYEFLQHIKAHMK